MPWSPRRVSRAQEWTKMRIQVRFSWAFHIWKSMTVKFTIGNIHRDGNIGFLGIPELSSQEFTLSFVIRFFIGNNRKAFWDLYLFWVGGSRTLGMSMNPRGCRSSIKTKTVAAQPARLGVGEQRKPGAYVSSPYPIPTIHPPSLKSNNRIFYTFLLYVFKNS